MIELLTPDEVLKAIQEGKQVEVKFGEHYEWEDVLPNKMILEELIDPEHQFRLPQQFVCIDDIEFPKPETKEPKEGVKYYYPDFVLENYIDWYIWENSEVDNFLLKAGLIHLTPENATAHSKALIKLSGGSYE